jgi:predicted nucleotidyltransferase
MPGERLPAMSGIPRAPAAPRLRAIRDVWLRRAVERLEADPAVSAAGFVGSLGRGDADDWSDVDLLIVVPDDQVEHYADATQLPGSEQVTWSVDARHNAPNGAADAELVAFRVVHDHGVGRVLRIVVPGSALHAGTQPGQLGGLHLDDLDPPLHRQRVARTPDHGQRSPGRDLGNGQQRRDRLHADTAPTTPAAKRTRPAIGRVPGVPASAAAVGRRSGLWLAIAGCGPAPSDAELSLT